MAFVWVSLYLSLMSECETIEKQNETFTLPFCVCFSRTNKVYTIPNWREANVSFDWNHVRPKIQPNPISITASLEPHSLCFFFVHHLTWKIQTFACFWQNEISGRQFFFFKYNTYKSMCFFPSVQIWMTEKLLALRILFVYNAFVSSIQKCSNLSEFILIERKIKIINILYFFYYVTECEITTEIKFHWSKLAPIFIANDIMLLNTFARIAGLIPTQMYTIYINTGSGFRTFVSLSMFHFNMSVCDTELIKLLDTLMSENSRLIHTTFASNWKFNHNCVCRQIFDQL